MDQGDVSTTGTHHARLLLIFLGAVLGFLALSFVFGSSSASADDGDDSRGLLASVDVVADTVTAVTSVATEPAASPVTAIATPATTAADEVVTSLLGDPVGTSPVTSIIVPVTTLADTALIGLQDAVGPLLSPVTGTLGAALTPATGPIADAGAASGAVVSAPVTVLGVAAGLLASPVSGGLGQPDATGAVPAPGALAAVATGIAFATLLVLRRRALPPVIVPGDPVYDTGSSPD